MFLESVGTFWSGPYLDAFREGTGVSRADLGVMSSSWALQDRNGHELGRGSAGFQPFNHGAPALGPRPHARGADQKVPMIQRRAGE